MTAFGPAVLGADGALDRAALGKIVFEDPTARARLNAITHPRIASASASRIAELAAADPPYVVYEAALLVENGAHRGFAALVVVAAEEHTQLARLMARDKLSEAAARARIAAQLPLGDKIAVADYVIRNDGSLTDLQARSREVHQSLVVRLGGRL